MTKASEFICRTFAVKPTRNEEIMATFEVTCNFMIETTVRVVVEADSKDEAIDRVSEIAPSIKDRRGWNASVTIKGPAGIEASAGKVTAMQQTSGGDKARKLA